MPLWLQYINDMINDMLSVRVKFVPFLCVYVVVVVVNDDANFPKIEHEFNSNYLRLFLFFIVMMVMTMMFQ